MGRIGWGKGGSGTSLGKPGGEATGRRERVLEGLGDMDSNCQRY